MFSQSTVGSSAARYGPSISPRPTPWPMPEALESGMPRFAASFTHRAVDIRTGNAGAEHVERQHFEAQVVGAGAADARVHVLAYVGFMRAVTPQYPPWQQA